MDSVFLSIVGTQIMGTLQPWLSFAQKYSPARTILLHTAKTKDLAEKLWYYALEHALGDVALRPVSDKTGNGEGTARTIVQEIAEEAKVADQRIGFNLDGGMNYLINDCVLALAPYDPLLIQSSRWRSLLHDTRGGEFMEIPLPKALPVEDILNLQAVPHSLAQTNPDEFTEEPFLRICAKNNLKLPANRLENVEIDGIVFDLVWNPGNNRLCFLKDWRFVIDNNAERLARERDFAHWSTDRNRSGQMYDKQTFALVRDTKSKNA